MFFQPHNVELLNDVDYGFEEPELQQVAAEFREAMQQTQQDLIREGVDVDKYIPLEEIATSIQY